MKKPNKCSVCRVSFNESWHDANGWHFRMGMRHYLPPRINTNCCHCPHHNCVSTSCEQYHKEKDDSIYGSIYHQIALVNPASFKKGYLQTIGINYKTLPI